MGAHTMYIYKMANINISIKKEAYEFLKTLKARDRSFSDVILEFKKSGDDKGTARDLLRFAGALKDLDFNWKEKESRMRELRNSFNSRMKKRIE